MKNSHSIARGDDVCFLIQNFDTWGAKSIFVGTIGLELHGALPLNYLCNDIDVLIFADSDKFAACEKNLYNWYNEYRKKIRYTKELSGMSVKNKCYIFTLSSGVKVNAWLKPIEEFDEYRICKFTISEYQVNTLTFMKLIRHKLSLRRQKDFEFFTNLIRSILWPN